METNDLYTERMNKLAAMDELKTAFDEARLTPQRHDGPITVELTDVELIACGEKDEICLKVSFVDEDWKRTVFYNLENPTSLRYVKQQLMNLTGQEKLMEIVAKLKELSNQGHMVAAELRTMTNNGKTYQNLLINLPE